MASRVFWNRLESCPAGSLPVRARRGGNGKKTAVDFIHGRKIIQVLKEYGRLYHVMEVGTGRFQDALHVFKRSLRLLANIAAGQFAGFWIEGYLSGQVKKPVGLDGLRIRPDGFRPAVCMNNFFHGTSSLEERVARAATSSWRARNSSGTPGCFIHKRTNSATFWCVSCSNAAIRSSRLNPRPCLA